jgi:twitching motility protein PilI
VLGNPARLILLGARTGEQNAGIVVQRVLGLRNLAQLRPAHDDTPGPAWHVQRWLDADGDTWQEIDLGKLASDPAFLQVGA